MTTPQSVAGGALSNPSCFWHPADDWTTLVGLNVELHERGIIIDQGRVEAATDDGCILWLAQEGACTRRLWEFAPERYVKTATAHP